MKEVPDLIRRLEAQAEEDDAADRRAQSESYRGTSHTMTTLGDTAIGALMNVFIPSYLGEEIKVEDARFRSSPDRRAMNFGDAAYHLPAGADAASVISMISRAESVLESPIEKSLLPWLVCHRYEFWRQPTPVYLPGELPSLSDSLFITPQLSFGKYRLDFAITARTATRSIIVGVECDGAEFHDIGADRVRDAYFAAFRIPIVRASGTEIRREPQKVVERVSEMLSGWMRGGGG